jgi:hypothetical protein
MDISAHEVELMNIVLLGRMNSYLCWGQPEDKPTFANVYMWEP